MMGRKSVFVCLMMICGILMLVLVTGDNEYTELTFSKESGFYDAPFELELYAPIGTEIFYTLDGSNPDENAAKYTKPIRIADATENENVYSMRTDVLLYPGFVPDYYIDKCTVVRSAYRDTDGNFSDVKTGVYYVDYGNKAGYDDLYVISIVTDPGNLFGYESGIYVSGSVHDEVADVIDDQDPDNDHLWWRANYTMKGPEWERTADIQLFDAERNLVLSKTCGVRIQGGGSRSLIPRSMNLYAREQYDGKGRFYLDLFHTGYMAGTITLSTGGQDSVSKLRDMLVTRLVSGRNFSTMHFVPCAMFLDGEYWGVYWITEKYDDKYLGYYHNVDDDNIVMVKNGNPSEGEENYGLYTEMMDYMAHTDLSIDDNYAYACELIDINSYIDYYVTEIYVGNEDWPVGNEALWRVYEIEDTKYGDGKWRWMLFDLNSSGSLSPDLPDKDTISSTMDKSAMFCNLCQNENFKKRFTVTFMDIINTSFTSENIDAIISDYVALMEEPMDTHFKRFFGERNNLDFLGEVADIQDFLDNRRPYIVKYLKDDFGLSGTLAPVELEINDPVSGSIVLNTVEPSFDLDGKWSGEYYTDYPITLTASANEGYRFVRWEITDALKNEAMDEEAIELPIPESGISIKAIFEKN